MKTLLFIVFFIFIFCLLVFCSIFLSRKKGRQDTPVPVNNAPKAISNVVQNYWDNLNVADTATLFRKELGEQQLVNYLYLLDKASPDSARSGLISLANKMLINQAVFDHFFGLIENYLYHPDSPLRNEEQYITVLEYYMQDERLDAQYKVRLQYQLNMLYKNRLGHVAKDFTFITPSGSECSLYSVNAPFTLLLFYDPDCENCRETIRQLSNNRMLKAMQYKNKLQVLAIYTADNIKLWQDYASSIPTTWINGSDKQQINKQKRYDLRAFPTLYLLDKDKKVLLKDAYMDVVLDTLGTVEKKLISY